MRAIRGEKGGVEIEAGLPYPIRLLRPPSPRALPKIRIPLNPRAAEQLVKTEDPARADTRYVTSKEIHSTRGQEWIKATERS